MTPTIAPYGTWESPITPDDFATACSRFEGVQVDKSKNIYLGDIRAQEQGRCALVQLAADGASKDVLPFEYSALSQVHEYGGASFVSRHDGHLIFTDVTSKAILDLNPADGSVETIIDGDEKVYYADFDAHPSDNRWVLAIKENHHPPTIAEIENTLVILDTKSEEAAALASGADFYLYPRFSPDGKQICWIQFSFPSMPWNHTELWVADFEDGKITNQHIVAGEDDGASTTQPLWAAGSLYFVNDRSGWWQLYRLKDGQVEHIALKGLEHAEFGGPDWWLGSQTYGALTEDSLVAFANMDGRKKLIQIDVRHGDWKDLGCSIIHAVFNAVKVVDSTTLAIIGATSKIAEALFLVDINNASSPKLLKSTVGKQLAEEYASVAKSIKFPRKHGPGGGVAYGIFFPPTNPDFNGPDGSLPPLIVAMHGGPTWQEFPELYMRDAFLTTRGYAVVQVNYVGSTGYGKEYIASLGGNWGKSDIGDAVSCVEYLAEQGLIDKNRVAITGHSAGGYATMQGMAVYPDIWACGVAESGISELSAFFGETHKFESHYLQTLCWPSDATEEQIQEAMKDRSPITRAANIKAPILILGGKDDPICPPNQNTLLAEKIKEGGGTVEMKLYDGEGHMFLQGSTLKDIEVRREAFFRKYLVDE